MFVPYDGTNGIRLNFPATIPQPSLSVVALLQGCDDVDALFLPARRDTMGTIKQGPWDTGKLRRGFAASTLFDSPHPLKHVDMCGSHHTKFAGVGISI